MCFCSLLQIYQPIGPVAVALIFMMYLVKLGHDQRSKARGIENSLEMMNTVLLPHKSGSSLITELPHWEDGSVGVMLFSHAIVLRIQ